VELQALLKQMFPEAFEYRQTADPASHETRRDK